VSWSDWFNPPPVAPGVVPFGAAPGMFEFALPDEVPAVPAGPVVVCANAAVAPNSKAAADITDSAVFMRLTLLICYTLKRVNPPS